MSFRAEEVWSRSAIWGQKLCFKIQLSHDSALLSVHVPSMLAHWGRPLKAHRPLPLRYGRKSKSQLNSSHTESHTFSLLNSSAPPLLELVHPWSICKPCRYLMVGYFQTLIHKSKSQKYPRHQEFGKQITHACGPSQRELWMSGLIIPVSSDSMHLRQH